MEYVGLGLFWMYISGDNKRRTTSGSLSPYKNKKYIEIANCITIYADQVFKAMYMYIYTPENTHL